MIKFIEDSSIIHYVCCLNLRRDNLPTYEYRCLKCKHTFEQFQSMKDEPLKICPNCKGELKRLIGAGAGTIFRGSGFYQTDYKNNSAKTESKKSDPAKPSEKTSDNKVEKKGTTDNK